MCRRRNNNDEFRFIARGSECRRNECRCEECCRRRDCDCRRDEDDFSGGNFFSGEERERQRQIEIERQRERQREIERERDRYGCEGSRRCVIRNNRCRQKKQLINKI